MPPTEPLPTIAFSKEFLTFLGLSEQDVYALKPVFAARCERFTTTYRYVERAVLVTQKGELILIDPSDRKKPRITNRIPIGDSRPHKKLIVQADKEPNAKGKQTVRLFTEPLSPLADEDKPQWNRFDMKETEEEFEERIKREAEERGEFLPDVDLALMFHCKRAPIATQFVTIVRHFALPIGDFYVELEETPVLDQIKQDRSVAEVLQNVFKPPKPTKKKAIQLADIAIRERVELQAKGEPVFVPPPVVAPRIGGTKSNVEAAAEIRFGVDEKLAEKERRRMRQLEKEFHRSKRHHRKGNDEIADGEEEDDEENLYDDDDEAPLIDHLPQYTFDDPDPEDVEKRRLRMERPPRKPLDELSLASEEDEAEDPDNADSDDSDNVAKRKLKKDPMSKSEIKKRKKMQEKAEKERKEAAEAAEKKRNKLLLSLAQARRDSERLAKGYRYKSDYRDDYVEDPPHPLYRTAGKKAKSKSDDSEGVRLFVIRAPQEEESLALTSLCFFRRNVVVLLNPATDPDEQETLSIAVASAGQFLVCKPTVSKGPNGEEVYEESDDGASSGGRGFPMSSITKCLIEFSNHYCNGMRSGYVTLTIDLNAKENKKKRKKIAQNGGRITKAKRRGSRKKNKEVEYDEDGYPIEDEFDDDGQQDDDEEEEEVDPELELDFDLRTIELDLDDVCCGDMHPDDAECCNLYYFADLVKHFNEEAEIIVEEPPINIPEANMSYEEEAEEDPASMPAGAVMAARMMASAANRALAAAGSTNEFAAPVRSVAGDTTPSYSPAGFPLGAASFSSSSQHGSPAGSAVPLQLTPESIKERGDQLRRIIDAHKKSGRWQDAEQLLANPHEMHAHAEEEKTRHRALASLLFQIAERKLAGHQVQRTGVSLQRKASSVLLRSTATLTSPASPAPRFVSELHGTLTSSPTLSGTARRQASSVAADGNLSPSSPPSLRTPMSSGASTPAQRLSYKSAAAGNTIFR